MRRVVKELKKSKDFSITYEPDHMYKSLIGKVNEFTYDSKIEDGKVVKVMSRVDKDPRDNFKNYRVTDFCMENIIAVGADGSLKAVQFTNQDIDLILNQLPKLEEK